MIVNVSDYTEEKVCKYKDEVYSVRDNGAVMRLSPEGKKTRPLDNVWTFGKKSVSNGYMTIGSHRVHIIVATAFYGAKDSKIYVVDHIDTNRCNNRTENLRWLTKLENILLNDFTREKIEWICGSVERFLENPSLLRGHELEDRNFEWMRTVSKQEAENTLENWKSLMERPKRQLENNESIGDWIYNKSITSHSVAFSKVKTPEQMQEERLQALKRSKEVRMQIEQDKIRKANQKILEAKEREKQKRDRISIIKESIISLAKFHGWHIEKNICGNGWKADFIVSTPNNRVAIILNKTTRDIRQKHLSMEADGIKDCWLGCTYSEDVSNELFPCFDVEIEGTCIKAKLSENQCISLSDLLLAMMSNRLQVEHYLIVKKVKLRFIPISCYRCGAEHYLYIVNSLISNGFSYDGLNDLYDIVKPFNPIIINSVKRYLYEHPELNYPMGEIKKRFSKTREEQYLSFGCPKCDGLVGDYYVEEYTMDAIYSSDDEYVHVIDLEEPGLKLDYKHWVVL